MSVTDDALDILKNIFKQFLSSSSFIFFSVLSFLRGSCFLSLSFFPFLHLPAMLLPFLDCSCAFWTVPVFVFSSCIFTFIVVIIIFSFFVFFFFTAFILFFWSFARIQPSWLTGVQILFLFVKNIFPFPFLYRKCFLYCFFYCKLLCPTGLATAAGCQLVATCDIAVVTEQSRFATPGYVVIF